VVEDPVVAVAAAVDVLSVDEPPAPVDPEELPPDPTVDAPDELALVPSVVDPVVALFWAPSDASEAHAPSAPAAMRMEMAIDEIVFTRDLFFGLFFPLVCADLRQRIERRFDRIVARPPESGPTIARPTPSRLLPRGVLRDPYLLLDPIPLFAS
jgi:hypothetical protein